ncbi:MAG: 4Fe-4S binding protein [Chloroflexi bacterium]|nr:4Fe-4S binding protein [Chloroflexota bacterium]
MQRAIFRDKDKCVGCYACVVACKMEHGLAPTPVSPPEAEPKGVSLTSVYRYGPFMEGDRVIQYYVPMSCMHCVDAPCIQSCPKSALRKDAETGITVVDKEKCIGCRFCLWVCPYGAPRYNEQGKCELCDLCERRFHEGKKKTACEAVCVASAIFSGTIEEVADFKAKKAAKKLVEGAAVI